MGQQGKVAVLLCGYGEIEDYQDFADYNERALRLLASKFDDRSLSHEWHSTQDALSCPAPFQGWILCSPQDHATGTCAGGCPPASRLAVYGICRMSQQAEAEKLWTPSRKELIYLMN